MTVAIDTLSLLFIGCFVIGVLFLLITAFAGHGHQHSIGHGHGGHAHLVHAAHGAHAAAHTTNTASHTTNHNQQGSHFSILAIVNPLTIALFLFGFGFFGYVLHATAKFALPLIFIFACLAGLAITGILIIMLNRIFGNIKGATIQDVSDRTGLLGKVNMTIPAMGIGEIIYVSPGGMRKSVPARSIDGRRLEREQEVVVVNYQSGVAEVDTWEHFVNREDAISGE